MKRPDNLPEDHHCAWREWAEVLEERVDTLEARLAVLERHVFGRRSEKLPAIKDQLRVGNGRNGDAAQERRRENAEKRAELPERLIHHRVPDDKRVCPKCGGRQLRSLGEGKLSTVYEHIAEHFERQVHVQETLACRCGEGIVTAEPPAKVVDKGLYGPGFIAHLVTAKCGDSLPLYRYTWIAKRTGGHRLLEAPKSRLRDIQRRVLDGILARIPPHASAHGFRQGHSILDFVAPHVHRPIVVRVDLQAFFTSVFAGRVYGVFRTAGYPEEVARTLTALCTHRTPSDVLASAPATGELDRARLRAPHLPQGAPSSGAIANLAAYRLDVRLSALVDSVGARYSRYADDLVVSGERDLIRSAPTLVARIGAIAIEDGFAVNFRKTRVMTSGARQRVAGIVLNEKPSIARVEIDRLRAILHNSARSGPSSQNRDGHADFRAHLLGRIAWVSQVDRVKGARLRSLFDCIAWT